MIHFEANQLLFLYKILWLIIPMIIIITTYFFIFFNKKIEKLEETVNKHFDKLDTRLKEEEDKNKEFRHSHYKMDESISTWMDDVMDSIKQLTVRIRKSEKEITKLETLEHLK